MYKFVKFLNKYYVVPFSSIGFIIIKIIFLLSILWFIFGVLSLIFIIELPVIFLYIFVLNNPPFFFLLPVIYILYKIYYHFRSLLFNIIGLFSALRHKKTTIVIFILIFTSNTYFLYVFQKEGAVKDFIAAFNEKNIDSALVLFLAGVTIFTFEIIYKKTQKK